MTVQALALALPPLATIGGKAVSAMPADLFIPPDALEILLDSFAGPLDILLYLIRHQNLDILDIPIAQVTRQYLQYIQLMEARRMELAADYLVMAAMLAEIKSRMLLPIVPSDREVEEEDPRLALVRKLQIYEQFKAAAQTLESLPQRDRDFFPCLIAQNTIEGLQHSPDVDLASLTQLMQEILIKQGHEAHHQITIEPLSVQQRMSLVLERLEQEKCLSFAKLLRGGEGRRGLVVTLLAILELARQSLVLITQASMLAPIYLEALDHG